MLFSVELVDGFDFVNGLLTIELIKTTHLRLIYEPVEIEFVVESLT